MSWFAPHTVKPDFSRKKTDRDVADEQARASIQNELVTRSAKAWLGILLPKETDVLDTQKGCTAILKARRKDGTKMQTIAVIERRFQELNDRTASVDAMYGGLNTILNGVAGDGPAPPSEIQHLVAYLDMLTELHKQWNLLYGMLE